MFYNNYCNKFISLGGADCHLLPAANLHHRTSQKSGTTPRLEALISHVFQRSNYWLCASVRLSDNVLYILP